MSRELSRASDNIIICGWGRLAAASAITSSPPAANSRHDRNADRLLI